jgi:Ca2+-transporting ATPase
MRRPLQVSRLEGLTDDTTGLTAAAADERRSRYGPNDIVDVLPGGWADLARETGRDPMIWFLAATAALFLWLGDYAEAAVLAAALVPLVGMDALLHRRTQASTAGLAGQLATTASVVRDGRSVEIASTALVPGDLVAVAAGDAIPADGLIVASADLQVEESALTGEAMPVRKAEYRAPLGAAAEVAIDAQHWAFAGTRVLTGGARVRVAYTGGDTVYGEIVRSARAGQRERTPLQLAIDSLVKTLVVVAAVFCAALAAVRWQQGHGLIDAIMSAVTLAVAALPEEFPVVFAFFLGAGIYRLARRRALVRRAVVVENIGRITCICSDKTGTLTEGQLRLEHAEPAAGIGAERLIAVAGAASRLDSGDPLDSAIAGAGAPLAGDSLERFPFTEDRRREVAVLRTPAGATVAVAKGAPETIYAMASLAPAEHARWLDRTRELATTGHKVIAVAERVLAPDAWPGGEPDRGFTLVGLLAFEDPVREGAAAAVATAQRAGIRVIMVTGDHPATARAVAGELRLSDGSPRVITGDALAELLDRDGVDALRDVDVIARAVPAQKLGLVRALQESGEIVAVTGDGVNDVPALQAADVGIAMGERGTRSAREVAAIVLLDDNFRTIVHAIAEGRQLFSNLQRSFAYLLMVHIPLVLTAALVPLAGFPLLYLPAHIVWLELVIHPTAILAFQAHAPEGALRAARHTRSARFFDRREWLVIGAVGLSLAAGLLAAAGAGAGAELDAEHARSMALATLVIGSAAVTLGLTKLRGTAARAIAVASVASAVVLIETRPLAALLHVAPLTLLDWVMAGAAGVLAGAVALAFGTPGKRGRVERPAASG